MGNDGLQIGLVALRVLLIDDDLVRAVAAFGKAVDEALIGLIQRAVLDNLDDADLDLSWRQSLALFGACPPHPPYMSAEAARTAAMPAFIHFFMMLLLSCCLSIIRYTSVPYSSSCRSFQALPGRN